MKKIVFILITVIGLGIIISCEKENDNPVLNLNQIQAPTLSTEADNLVLLEDNAEDPIVFTWTTAQYSIDNIEDIDYILEMKHADSAAYMEVLSTPDTEYSTTVTAFNQKLLGLGFPPEVSMDFLFRVKAFINTDSDLTDAYSDVLTMSVTPYEEAVEMSPIYLLGNGTEPGWDNTAALEMTYVEGGKFEIVATLSPGDDTFIKFIANLGAWAPQWGTDDAGTWDSGNLVYRPSEDVDDPPAIPSPPDAGDYLIQADTANLTYTVSPATKYKIKE